MIEIALQGSRAEGRKAKIDDQDLELVKWKRWTYHQGYAITTGGQAMHRLIAGCTDRNKNVKWKNGDKLDNRRENLEIVSRLQNGKNPPASRSTEHEGITFNPAKQRYAVILYDRETRVELGEYPTIEEAVSVRDAEQRHGGYTRSPKKREYSVSNQGGRLCPP